jgi:hypothetical protein
MDCGIVQVGEKFMLHLGSIRGLLIASMGTLWPAFPVIFQFVGGDKSMLSQRQKYTSKYTGQ